MTLARSSSPFTVHIDPPSAQARSVDRAKPDGAAAPGVAPVPARVHAVVMRLAAEVETLKSELAAAQAQVAELELRADVDPLLGILNRRSFERELKRAIAYVQRYETMAALIYIDLDGFKALNDTHGHAAGDAVLKAAAGALVGNVRASDVVGRLGGDELAVLLWNITAADAAAKAEALERKIAGAAVSCEGRRLAACASAGMAMLAPSDDSSAVLARADRAMYARKAKKGRGRGSSSETWAV